MSGQSDAIASFYLTASSVSGQSDAIASPSGINDAMAGCRRRYSVDGDLTATSTVVTSIVKHPRQQSQARLSCFFKFPDIEQK